MKRIHYFSGLTLTIFVGLHLFNHFCSIWGADQHIAMMNRLQVVYRNGFAEAILLLAVSVQIASGLRLFYRKRKHSNSSFEKLQIWTGLYLSIFFLVHLGAIFTGRFILHLDTNFYFGVAGLNTFPYLLFFIPYYGFAILSFFGHVASIHHQKMKRNILGLNPRLQSKAILFLGISLTILIFYGLTNGFTGVEIPSAYNVLIGK